MPPAEALIETSDIGSNCCDSPAARQRGRARHSIRTNFCRHLRGRTMPMCVVDGVRSKQRAVFVDEPRGAVDQGEFVDFTKGGKSGGGLFDATGRGDE